MSIQRASLWKKSWSKEARSNCPQKKYDKNMKEGGGGRLAPIETCYDQEACPYLELNMIKVLNSSIHIKHAKTPVSLTYIKKKKGMLPHTILPSRGHQPFLLQFHIVWLIELCPKKMPFSVNPT